MTKAVVPGENRESRAAKAQAHLLRALEGFTKSGILAGKYLYEIDDERLYMELGFQSMREYLVSPEVDMRADVAYRLVRCFRQFVVVGSLTLEDIAGVSISKLDIAQRYLDRAQPDDLVEWARDMTRSDLEEHLAEKFNEGKRKKRAKRKVECPNCGSEFVP